MEAAQRQREVAAERARIEAERKAAENERIARETAANLERMRHSWAESQALQQARSRPPRTYNTLLRQPLALPGIDWLQGDRSHAAGAEA